jgi:hypothetical protein
MWVILEEYKPVPLHAIQALRGTGGISSKFKDISLQLPASLLDVSAATRELWWTNQE